MASLTKKTRSCRDKMQRGKFCRQTVTVVMMQEKPSYYGHAASESMPKSETRIYLNRPDAKKKHLERKYMHVVVHTL